MERKLREAGGRQVWMVDPIARTVRVHAGPSAEQSASLREADTLDGGEVVPGFSVAVAEVFPTPND
jgi:Uma2 family endonuclease